mmetsp:Transcript_64465/g.153878  ORF Transcript_64465/g.153878 Transcript_64465/m.153878 type:complete len:210 (+) Transcript_64465:978-1607(+)
MPNFAPEGPHSPVVVEEEAVVEPARHLRHALAAAVRHRQLVGLILAEAMRSAIVQEHHAEVPSSSDIDRLPLAKAGHIELMVVVAAAAGDSSIVEDEEAARKAGRQAHHAPPLFYHALRSLLAPGWQTFLSEVPGHLFASTLVIARLEECDAVVVVGLKPAPICAPEGRLDRAGVARVRAVVLPASVLHCHRWEGLTICVGEPVQACML